MGKRMIRLITIFFLFFGLVACTNDETSQTNDKGKELSSNNTAEQTSEEVEQSPEELFNKVKNNSPTSERIKALEDIAMHYYWYGGDVKKAEKDVFKGITLHGDYDVVEEAFRQATKIDPYNLDLKYSLASAHILQKEIPEALDTYQQILAFDNNQFNARLLYAIYSKVQGNDKEFESNFDELIKMNKEKADLYKKRIELVEQIKEEPFNRSVPDDLSKKNHAFVVLGYALSDEGEMQDTLKERLKVAKKAADTYPNSKIIVSGGVPKKGNTEADVMFDWLTEQGIDKDRIIKEDLATDTVENALFSMDIAEQENIEDITLITSASHMRRALVIFNEINQMHEKINNETPDRQISNIVYMDYDSDEEAKKVTKDEELVVYRDLMRASGIWAFPGLQR
ncbi:YdcF family protein [Virgibacillus dakarensis]|nr:YdcF family protein [Virgibacillus dakarensis]